VPTKSPISPAAVPRPTGSTSALSISLMKPCASRRAARGWRFSWAAPTRSSCAASPRSTRPTSSSA